MSLAQVFSLVSLAKSQLIYYKQFSHMKIEKKNCFYGMYYVHFYFILSESRFASVFALFYLLFIIFYVKKN